MNGANERSERFAMNDSLFRKKKKNICEADIY